ncbi:MAG: UvrD-helicase domain-containing protein, partial [Bacteroidaceae bacterium]|nr:UvrD-helicase domain-containing protein [Bacteroidaceae bacterium]
AVIQNRISTAKNRLYTSEMYSQNADILKADSFKNIPMTKVIYEKYTERCRKADAMDFDDLLLNTYLLLKNNPEIQQKYAGMFRYILVDEYQDTNHAQHSIVWLLTRGGARLCVVGDDAQSIYSFRGANIHNMLSFEKLYPDSKLFKLEQNYRSTQTIVNAAGSLIAKNHSQIRKNVFSENEKGEKIELTRAHSDLEEATMVVNKLLDLHTYHNVDWNETAILYRTNGQSRVLEETFRKSGLPYRIYGSLSFYQRKEIKDTLAYLRVIVNPSDEESIKRIINFPKRGIGDTTINKLKDAALQYDVTLWDVICNPTDYGVAVNSGTQKKLYDFSTLLRSLMTGVSTSDAYAIAKRVYEESGLIAELSSDKTPEGMARKENVEELMSGIQLFCKDRIEEGSNEIYLSDYLSSVSLMTDQDKDDDAEVSKVTMMTIHASKGLEFKAVMIVGLEETLFPSDMSSTDHELEEERRLMYVAMTRAEKYLYLFHSTTRFRHGNVEANQPSRFLRDIDPVYINKVVEEPLSKPRFTSSSNFGFSSFESSSKPFFKSATNGSFNNSR